MYGAFLVYFCYVFCCSSNGLHSITKKMSEVPPSDDESIYIQAMTMIQFPAATYLVPTSYDAMLLGASPATTCLCYHKVSNSPPPSPQPGQSTFRTYYYYVMDVAVLLFVLSVATACTAEQYSHHARCFLLKHIFYLYQHTFWRLH